VDGCIARMMRKPNRARSTSEAALLLLQGVGLLVCHESDRRDGPHRRARRVAFALVRFGEVPTIALEVAVG